MSGAPKRSHEDTLHLSSKHPHEDPSTYSTLVSSSSNEYHMSYDIGEDSRATKFPRTEFRDADRRSPLHSVYRISSSSSDSHTDHPVGAEKKIESRDSKDRDLRIENRDSKTEKKDLHVEARRDAQGAKSEKDLHAEGRDDIKDVRYDSKGDKMEKDGNSLVSSQMNWKESKEYQRGKRYSDAHSGSGSLDTWHMQRGNVQGSLDARKESSTAEEKEYVDAHEAVGDNKFDSRGDDKSKEKDRKRKDVKHRDWGEREKERIERRNSNQISNTMGDINESVKEDRDIDRLEREKKDHPKDIDRLEREKKDHPKDIDRLEREKKDHPKERENLKEREKEQNKKDSLNGMDKEVPNNEDELGGGSVKLPEQEVVLPEQKKQKDAESSKNVDHEAKEKKKERDVDLEGDKPDKRNRSCDKKSDDVCADGEGATEKEKEKDKENEREPYNFSGQHRRRIQRTRGSPQVPNREPRHRSSAQDNDGCQGKVEVPSVVYKVGESMQDLIKLWKEYEASQSRMEKNGESSNNGPTLVIRIPSEYVTATNRQVRGGQLWGTDVYTYDSDLVAVLMHTGYCRPTASLPPAAIQELRATIRVLPPQDCYSSTLRNNVRSRAWGSAVGCSYRVERCRMVKKGGGTIDLQPCNSLTSAMEPTLAPVAVERTMTTRAAASNALRQQRFVREITIQYNLCNEPWTKYSVSIVADKGLKKPLYTSARLKKGEVLYLETHFYRYELCFAGERMTKATPATQLHDTGTEKSQNHHDHSANGEKNGCDNVMIDAFRWSRCKKPLPHKVMLTVGIPLPLEHVEVLEENLDWEDVQWSQTGVWIAGKEYTLARVHFLSTN